MPKNPPLLPRLVASGDVTDRVEVQQTAFSHDVFGRYVCNDWAEVQASIADGAFPFDVVVLGGGMFGGYCAAKLYWEGAAQGLRILVLDAGAFLFPTHVQNLPQRFGGGVGGPRYNRTREDGTGTQGVVWGVPWISNEPFPGLAYCLGGRSLFFGGWAPRLTPPDLAAWPADVRRYLEGDATQPSAYELAEQETGVAQTTDYMMGPLHEALAPKLSTAAKAVPALVGVTEAPLAVEASAPASGLFPFDKFSSAPFLIDAVRHDVAVNTYAGDVSRRLMIVPRAHVTGLRRGSSGITTIDLAVNGTVTELQLAPTTAVVLAAGTIESTRLALDSLGIGQQLGETARVGNLMVHLRSNITVRVRRGALGLQKPPTGLETTAMLVRGAAANGRFHIQVTAGATGTADSEKNMWEQVPDIDLQDEMRASQDPDWVTLTLRVIVESDSDRRLSPDPARSWIDLSAETDENGRRRAYVHLAPTANDFQRWDAADAAAFALAAQLGSKRTDVQYWVKQPDNTLKWQPQPPSGQPFWRDQLGSSHHEAGPLFMGDPGASITDTSGRFHDVDNAYAVGPAVFPSIGSANPSLTGLTLTRRTSRAIIDRAAGVPIPAGFDALSLDPADWHMVSHPGWGTPLMHHRGALLETQGGYGLYWYTKEEFADFALSLEFRVAKLTDNSGVYLRIPSFDDPDALQTADTNGHEIQIDESGAPDGHWDARTGAIYKLQAPKVLVSAPVGQWNRCLIEAAGPRITVTLNGQLVNDYISTRRQTGFIALQCHHQGSRVQFRNLARKRL